MARPAKPWYRAGRDAWCVHHNGKLVTLIKGKANRNEAYRRFLLLESGGTTVLASETGRRTAKEICQMFIDHSIRNHKPKTAEVYKWFLEAFGNSVGSIDGNSLTPRHVTKFVEEVKIDERRKEKKGTWGATTRYQAITAIKRAWAWATDEGHLTLNGISKMKRPKPTRREEIPDDQEIATVLKAANPEFHELLSFVCDTGCRPGEAAMIEKRHVDLANREVRFRIGEDKTSGKTGKPRVIHLSDKSHAMLENLCRKNSHGTLFKNTRGKRWTKNAMNKAIATIREKTGVSESAVVYAMRHHWATNAIARGVPMATVAEMMGNSPEVVAKVYSHLSDKKSILLNAANIASHDPNARS